MFPYHENRYSKQNNAKQYVQFNCGENMEREDSRTATKNLWYYIPVSKRGTSKTIRQILFLLNVFSCNSFRSSCVGGASQRESGRLSLRVLPSFFFLFFLSNKTVASNLTTYSSIQEQHNTSANIHCNHASIFQVPYSRVGFT